MKSFVLTFKKLYYYEKIPEVDKGGDIEFK